jgi:glutamate-ammonia-ligase adenylyltransferase
MLERLPAGVQVLSLFWRNPALLDRVAGILGAAPPLAGPPRAQPGGAGRAAGGQRGAGRHGPRRVPARLVGDARHLDEALDAARRLVTERRFEIDAAALEGALDADTPGRMRADLAEAAIEALLPGSRRISPSATARCPAGRWPWWRWASSAGGRCCRAPTSTWCWSTTTTADAPAARAARAPWRPSEYFIRFAPRVVAALTAPGRRAACGTWTCGSGRPATRAGRRRRSPPSSATTARRPGPGSAWR